MPFTLAQRNELAESRRRRRERLRTGRLGIAPQYAPIGLDSNFMTVAERALPFTLFVEYTIEDGVDHGTTDIVLTGGQITRLEWVSAGTQLRFRLGTVPVIDETFDPANSGVAGASIAKQSFVLAVDPTISRARVWHNGQEVMSAEGSALVGDWSTMGGWTLPEVGVKNVGAIGETRLFTNSVPAGF